MSSLCELANVLHLMGAADAASAAYGRYLDLARKLGRPYDLAYALTFAANHLNLTGEHQEAKRQADDAIALSQTHGFGLWHLCATFEVGIAFAGLGRSQEAIAILEPSLTTWAAMGCRSYTCARIGWLAVCYADCGRLDEAMTTIDLAIRQANEVDDKIDLARLHRIRAEIMAKTSAPDRTEIERDLRKAIAVAQMQGAATLEAHAQARLMELFPHLAAAQTGESSVRGRHAEVSGGA